MPLLGHFYFPLTWEFALFNKPISLTCSVSCVQASIQALPHILGTNCDNCIDSRNHSQPCNYPLHITKSTETGRSSAYIASVNNNDTVCSTAIYQNCHASWNVLAPILKTQVKCSQCKYLASQIEFCIHGPCIHANQWSLNSQAVRWRLDKLAKWLRTERKANTGALVLVMLYHHCNIGQYYHTQPYTHRTDNKTHP